MSDTEVLNECKEFVRGQYSRNTGYTNNTSHNFFKRFTQSRGEWRTLEEIPPQKLNNLVSFLGWVGACFRGATEVPM